MSQLKTTFLPLVIKVLKIQTDMGNSDLCFFEGKTIIRRGLGVLNRGIVDFSDQKMSRRLDFTLLSHSTFLYI